MGRPTTAAPELAACIARMTLTSASARASDTFFPQPGKCPNGFNVWLSGSWSAGNVGINVSRDGGDTWLVLPFAGTATPMLFGAPTLLTLTEPEAGVIYTIFTDAAFAGSVAATFAGGWIGLDYGS